MFLALISIPDHLVNTVISALAIISGTLIGALCSWIITKKNTLKSIEEQYRIMKENVRREELYKNKVVCQNANIIRLDIATALFQSIRGIKEFEENKTRKLYPIPINSNYACTVSSLSDKYSLRELSYIYQLYAIIEKLNHDILNSNLHKEESFQLIVEGYKHVLIKVYGESYRKIIKKDIDDISYKELYNNEYTKSGCREVLEKLDQLCFIENLIKEGK